MFKKKGKLVTMREEHVEAALEIIKAHDEDDFECAAEGYEKSLRRQFVFMKGRDFIGVTGYSVDEDVATVSWTYVDEKYRRQGHGEEMLGQLLKLVKANKIRKIYIHTSDYREAPWQPMLYQAAIALYKKLGFKQEGYHPHYYEQDEGELIFGKHLKGGALKGGFASRENLEGIELTDVFQIEETDASYAIDWHEEGDDSLRAQDLEEMVETARKSGAESVFISFPSTFSLNIYSILSDAGFHEEAQLLDYCADGIHEVRYRINLDAKNLNKIE